MTTNAIDRKNRMLASDSRWSFDGTGIHAGFMFYVDDTDFEKIADRPTASIICAGDALLIQEWKSWFMTPVPGALPATERLDAASNQTKYLIVSIVDKRTAQQVLEWGTYTRFGEDAAFCGSGAEYALQCYSQNWDAVRSIATAAQFDVCTGGQTKFVELGSRKHNLALNNATVAHAEQEFLNRGIAMNKQTKKTLPMADYEKRLKAGQPIFNAGSFSLSAPTGYPHRSWTDTERDEAVRVMAEIAQREAAEAGNK